MAAKDFNLLGKTALNLPQSPEEAQIDTFPNQYQGRNYLISFDCLDFTSQCPVTGQSDFAKIKIEYIPNELCIETKSLKYFMQSFRNQKSFNEQIINTILLNLSKACSPKWMKVHGDFAARGGIQLSCTAVYPDLDMEAYAK